MTMEFDGLAPPEFNVPLIELEAVDGTSVDLYNESTLRGATFDADGLTFEFASDKVGRVALRFSALRGLRVEQPSDWDVRETAQIEHLLIRPEGPWPRVSFKAGGLEYEFDCDVLSLRVRADAGPQSRSGST